MIRDQFKGCIPGWIRRLPKVEDNWSALLQTLEGHNNLVISVAFSHDGKQLASASRDKTVKLWDAGSGALQRTLEGHDGSVRSVAFSHDGKQLASASDDRTIKLWDAGSGALLQTLHTGAAVYSLAFCDDGTFLCTERGLLPIQNPTASAAFSQPDAQHHISVSDQWVSHGSRRMLWLPREHRPSEIDVHGSTIDLGYMSGRVTVMEFSF